MSDLSKWTIAILATTGFEDTEVSQAKHAVEQAGGRVLIVAPQDDIITGKRGTAFTPDMVTPDADAASFTALILPGGVTNADQLRLDEHAVALVRGMAAAGKPIAAICHGAWILTDADAVRGRTLTSSPTLRTDLVNAGATWVDEEVHVDDGSAVGDGATTSGLLITSRTRADIDAFNAAIVANVGR
ncbi:type 1 glutamine amidotransferase domain-containing protein [uncultured Corynebacterium sp.]|uniref:type 1 glutamine amidotransferase domain-containing protein n=1 Tax=uncultured Corynebacterium sp. TaxID=159447 RepID=UPI0025E96CC2|nr:type 1 glutamine amidotransferase domain-containing protein [uncultured Corynebacterium sp.]